MAPRLLNPIVSTTVRLLRSRVVTLGRSNNTVVLVPPRPPVILAHDAIVVSQSAGK